MFVHNRFFRQAVIIIARITGYKPVIRAICFLSNIRLFFVKHPARIKNGKVKKRKIDLDAK